MRDERDPIEELELGRLWRRHQEAADEATLAAIPVAGRQIRPREFRRRRIRTIGRDFAERRRC